MSVHFLYCNDFRVGISVHTLKFKEVLGKKCLSQRDSNVYSHN
jgi:hypothetical protein